MTTFCFWLFSIAAAHSVETIEFYHLDYGQTVTPKPDACGKYETDSEPGLMPCSADPYRDACAKADSKVKKRLEHYEQKLKPLSEAMRVDLEQKIAAARKKLGPVPPVGGRHFHDYEEKFRELVSAKPGDEVKAEQKKLELSLERDRPTVQKTIAKAKQHFLKMLKKRGNFGEYAATIEAMLDCVNDASVSFTENEFGRNASLHNHMLPVRAAHQIAKKTDNPEFTLEKPKGKNQVNPLLEARSHCALKLSPQAWMECTEGSSTCMYLLFHELGHLMNTCPLHNAAYFSSNELKEPSIKSKPAADKSLRFIKEHSTGLARILESKTSCLTNLSDPKFTPPNTCSDKSAPAVTRERCDLWATAGYPPQWEESEADLWAGSAFAQYLEDEIGQDTELRAKALYDIMSEWCGDQQMRKRWWGSLGPESRDTLSKLGISRKLELAKQEGCKPSPGTEKQYGPPWLDEHQTRETRFNRIVLRNLDLRDALGCKNSAEIPFTCSPSGTTRMNLPQ